MYSGCYFLPPFVPLFEEQFQEQEKKLIHSWATYTTFTLLVFNFLMTMIFMAMSIKNPDIHGAFSKHVLTVSITGIGLIMELIIYRLSRFKKCRGFFFIIK